MNDENYNIIVSYCETIDTEKNHEDKTNDKPITETAISNSQVNTLAYPKLVKKSSKEIISNKLNQFKTTDLNSKNKFSYSKKYSKSFNGDKSSKSCSKIKFNENFNDKKLENIMYDAYQKTDNFEEFYKELADKKLIFDEENYIKVDNESFNQP